MVQLQESTREQLLNMAKLSTLAGEILDELIDAKEAAIAETSHDIGPDIEQLLQDVDAYRERFRDLVGVTPHSEKQTQLAERLRQWREASGHDTTVYI